MGSSLLAFLASPLGCFIGIIVTALIAVAVVAYSCESSRPKEDVIEIEISDKALKGKELDDYMKRVHDSIMMLDPYYSREEFKPKTKEE